MIFIKKYLLFWFLLILFVLGGCSANKENAKMSESNSASMDTAQSGIQEKTNLYSEEGKVSEQKTGETDKLKPSSQMVIYQANLHLRVKKFEETVQSIETMAAKFGGYVAESNVVKEGSEQISGSIKIRVPQEHFQQFLHDAEGEAAEVIQRNITGLDVTEEYVDLESRLKSKKVVEERLMSFMKNTTKTEDLLKISSDLGNVQEEIETIQGRMKYLKNQTSLSTINITLFENKVTVPDLDKEKLNTWERTKKQFMNSTNLLLAGFSGLIVFVFGNLPILIILFAIGILTFLYFKKKNRNNNNL